MMKKDKRMLIMTVINFFLLSCCYIGCARSSKTVVNAPPSNTPPPSNYENYDPPLKRYVKGNSVNIRSGPGKEHDVVATGKKGQLITVSGKKEDWYYTQLKNGKDGYIQESLLTEVKPAVAAETSTTTTSFGFGDAPTSVPPVDNPTGDTGKSVTTTAQPTATPPVITAGLKPGKAKVNSLSATKVRSNASPFSKVNGELATGAQVEIIEVNGNWCQIRAGQIEGYVTSNSLIQ